jgi:hypothetical protein
MVALLEPHLQVETVVLSDLLRMVVAEVVNGKHHPVLVAPAVALVHLV